MPCPGTSCLQSPADHSPNSTATCRTFSPYSPSSPWRQLVPSPTRKKTTSSQSSPSVALVALIPANQVPRATSATAGELHVNHQQRALSRVAFLEADQHLSARRTPVRALDGIDRVGDQCWERSLRNGRTWNAAWTGDLCTYCGDRCVELVSAAVHTSIHCRSSSRCRIPILPLAVTTSSSSCKFAHAFSP